MSYIDGMIIKNTKGTRKYQYILKDGKRIRLHRYLVEKHLIEHKLSSNELIHHKDGNPLNNNIENLQIVTRVEHIRIHKPILGYRFTDKQKRRLSDTHKGFCPSAETRKKISNAHKGRKITWGIKISKAKAGTKASEETKRRLRESHTGRKITKEQAVLFLKKNSRATEKELMAYFKISRGPIFRLGGIKQLRREAVK